MAMTRSTPGSSLPSARLGLGARLLAPGSEKGGANRGWFAAIPDFEGVWASEPTGEETLGVLEETVLDWTILKIQHKDKDLPVLEEIDLNVL